MDMHAPRAEEAMLVISASLRGPKRLNLTPSEVNVPDLHLAPPLGVCRVYDYSDSRKLHGRRLPWLLVKPSLPPSGILVCARRFKLTSEVRISLVVEKGIGVECSIAVDPASQPAL